MTETTAMAESSDRQSNNYQPKKKKTDEPLPPDIGLKPVQLQRRRVWRACESCRYVLVSNLSKLCLAYSNFIQAEEDKVRWKRAYLFPVLDVQDPVHLAADKRQGSAQQTVGVSSF